MEQASNICIFPQELVLDHDKTNMTKLCTYLWRYILKIYIYIYMYICIYIYIYIYIYDTCVCNTDMAYAYTNNIPKDTNRHKSLCRIQYLRTKSAPRVKLAWDARRRADRE